MTDVEFDPAESAEIPASDAADATSCFIQQPLSVVEIAAGSIALVAVALVALFGLPRSQPGDSSPSAPVPTAAASASTIPKSQSRPEITGTVEARASESQASSGLWRPVDPVQANQSGSSAPAVAAAAAAPPKETAPVTLPSETAAAVPSKETAAATLPSETTAAAPPTETAPPTPPSETSAVAAPDTELNPQKPSDAIWMQARLGDLGYFSASRTGFWGPASRSALRDFKSMNGLQEDDQWDRETEQRLASREVIPATKTFVGNWAESIDQCRSERSAPIVINSRAARTTGGGCDFRSVKREAGAQWRVQAVCSAGKESWNANVNLKLDAPILIWSSERGIRTYVRCAKPELDGRTSVRHQVSRGTDFERALHDFVSRISIRDHP
jgi:Putative peptidoglycan binding domain